MIPPTAALRSQGRPSAIAVTFPLSFPESSRFHFHKPENYISMFHQEGSDTVYVGGQAVIYVLTFTSRGVRDLQVTFGLFGSTFLPGQRPLGLKNIWIHLLVHLECKDIPSCSK